MTNAFFPHASLQCAHGNANLSRRFAVITWLLLAGAMAFGTQAYAAPAYQNSSGVVCQRMDAADNGRGSYDMTGFDYNVGLFYQTTLIRPDAVIWTPGIEIAQETAGFRLMCHENLRGYTGNSSIYLKVYPTQEYLDSLRENGIDVEIHANMNGPARTIRLLEDNVSIAGFRVQLPNIRIIKWADTTRPYVFKTTDTTAVPWVDLTMKYVMRDSERRQRSSNSRHEVRFPSGNGLKILIHADGYESTGLQLRPMTANAPIQFGTCAAPLISINGTGQNTATIDFGNVALDMLNSSPHVLFSRSFTVALQVPPDSSPLCLKQIGSKPPRLRFVPARGSFNNGRMDGDYNLGVPGNTVVEIELRDDATGQLVGSPAGATSTQAFMKFEATQASRSFTASLKRKANSYDSLGPFLIPVLLEAFYQ